MKRRKIVIKKNIIRPIIIFIILFMVIVFGMYLKPKIIKIMDRKLFIPAVLKDSNVILASELSAGNIPISYLNYLDSRSIEASLSSGTKVIFSLEKDLSLQVSSLQLILDRFRIEGRKANSIDLRFKNVVVD